MLSVGNNDGTTETGSLMDDIVREGARRMLAAVLDATVSAGQLSSVITLLKVSSADSCTVT